jgi:hypothetical protein
MRTTVGQFHSRSQPITNIAPTRRGMSWLAWAFLLVMRRVSKLKMVQELEFIHFARWQRVRSKELPRLSPSQPEEDFTNDFFLFATNYNGDWDQYIDTFARVPRIRLGMWWLWRFSRGYPGPFPIRTFKAWIHYHTYPESLYYSAYRRSTVRNIRAALMVKSSVDQFVAASSPTETAAAFKQRYLTMVREIAPYLGSAPGLSPTAPGPSGTASPVDGAAPPAPAGRQPADIAFTMNGQSATVARWRRRSFLGPILGEFAHRKENAQSFITALSPIEVKPGHEVTDGIADLIAALGADPEPKPFSECPMLHMARILIIDDLRPALGVTNSGSLRTNYLLFIADLDGAVADFLDCLYAADPDFVRNVWGRCLGYPDDRSGPVYFRRYMERSALPIQLPYVAFPGHTAADIHGALELHVNLLEWLASDHRRMDDDELKTTWQGWLNQFLVGSEESP